MEQFIIKRNAQDILKIPKPIAVALDRVQSEKAFMGDVFEIWFELRSKCPYDY